MDPVYCRRSGSSQGQDHQLDPRERRSDEGAFGASVGSRPTNDASGVSNGRGRSRRGSVERHSGGEGSGFYLVQLFFLSLPTWRSYTPERLFLTSLFSRIQYLLIRTDQSGVPFGFFLKVLPANVRWVETNQFNICKYPYLTSVSMLSA